jgi:hypothetical protein
MPKLYVPTCDVREDGRGSGGAAPLTLPGRTLTLPGRTLTLTCWTLTLTCRPLTWPSRTLSLTGRLVAAPRRLAGLAAAVALTVLLRAALLATV